jgi:signal transduction histidine kinase
MDATRQAGMAEVATGVLHNVGNVLTSINVTANLLTDRFRDSKVTSIFKVCALLRDNSADLPGFFARDPRAAKLPSYLETLANALEKERTETMNELATLLKSIDHVKDVIWMQQSYASVSGIVEPLQPAETIEDAIKLSNNALLRHNVQVERQFALTPPARAERHKVLQILVNLISNAKKAMDCKEPSQRRLIIRVENGANEMISIKVTDNGVGIPPENLTKVFSHGFTTRKDGHGFGLHSSALAAKQMGGRLLADSDGGGRGATFTLDLPRWKEAVQPNGAKASGDYFAMAKTARPS